MSHEVRGIRDKSYFVLIALVFLLLTTWISSFLDSLVWVYPVLLTATSLIVMWAVWDFAKNPHNKRRYLTPILALFILLNSIASQMEAPGWMHVILIVLFAPVAVWVFQIVVRGINTDTR